MSMLKKLSTYQCLVTFFVLVSPILYTQENINSLISQLPQSVQEDLKLRVSAPREDKSSSEFNDATIDFEAASIDNSLINQKLADEEELFNGSKLSLFGYELLSSRNALKKSVYVGVNPTYILGAGDLLKIEIQSTETFFKTEYVLNEDSTIFIEGVGLIPLFASTLEDARRIITKKIKDSVIANDIQISLIKTKDIQVNVLGEINYPNSYLIKSNFSILDIIRLSGGINDIGSYRKIDIIRGNNVIYTFDLYDYLLNPSNLVDFSFNHGDIIFVNTFSRRVSIHGAVFREAIYELLEGEDLNTILSFSGGFKNNADKAFISIKTMNEVGEIQIFNPNLFSEPDIILSNDDEIYVPRQSSTSLNFVEFKGAFSKELSIAAKNLEGLSGATSKLADNAYPFFLAYRKFNKSPQSYEVIDTNSIENITDPGSVYAFSVDDINFLSTNIINQINNRIQNKELDNDLSAFISPGNCSLKTDYIGDIPNLFIEKVGQMIINSKVSVGHNQNYNDCPKVFQNEPRLLSFALNNSVIITGHSFANGIFPISPNTPLKDFINYLGGLDIYGNINDVKIQTKSGDVLNIDLSVNNISINPGDIVFVGGYQGMLYQEPINISGEVLIPGIYPYKSDYRLLDLINDAGGYSKGAFTYGGVLIRKSALANEKKSLDAAYNDLINSLASAITSGVVSSDVSSLIPLLEEYSKAEPTGRVVTEFDYLLIKSDPSLNILLEPGDQIFIPKFKNTITIVGEALSPISIPFSSNYTVNDYIEMAGGLTKLAASDLIYVVDPSGRSIPYKRRFGIGKKVMPGSVIFIPRDPLQYDGLRFAEKISPIISSLAISLASLNSIKN